MTFTHHAGAELRTYSWDVFVTLPTVDIMSLNGLVTLTRGVRVRHSLAMALTINQKNLSERVRERDHCVQSVNAINSIQCHNTQSSSFTKTSRRNFDIMLCDKRHRGAIGAG
ncbi:hypothetical protein KCU65_g183, partial [Aureobasidium melanogenum]